MWKMAVLDLYFFKWGNPSRLSNTEMYILLKGENFNSKHGLNGYLAPIAVNEEVVATRLSPSVSWLLWMHFEANNRLIVLV